MPLANDPTVPKPPKPPKRTTKSTQIAPVPAKVTPHLTRPVVRPSRPNFVPTANITAGRVSQAPPVMGPFAPNLAPQLSPTNRVGSALANLHQEAPQSNPTETPMYSHYAQQLQGAPYNKYAEQLAEQNAYNAMNSDSPANPDREPSQVLTQKEILRKISRRGGFGLYGARSPIQGFDFEADTNTFGFGRDPITGGTRNHTGEDMSMPAGTPIIAPVGGTVESATPNGGAYGNQIILNHGKGEESMYGHLSEMLVQPGEKVKKGDVIGYVGSTGRSTGPHLHWETWKDGQVLDPNTVFGRGAPPEGVIEAALEKFGGQQAPQGPPEQPQNYQNSGLAHNNGLDALMQAIREQESGGNYGVQNGIGAMGAYQVMPSNIQGDAGWDMEALGRNITGEEFLNNPTLQDNIARFKLRDYFKKYGAGGAAKAWYAGPGNASLNSNAPQYGGPSVNAYAESVLDIMRKYMGNQ